MNEPSFSSELLVWLWYGVLTLTAAFSRSIDDEEQARRPNAPIDTYLR